MKIHDKKGRSFWIDEADLDLIAGYTWHIGSNGYASTNMRHPDGGFFTLGMHRLLLGLGHGDPMEVDHVNGDRSDNRRSNLRLCTAEENAHNRRSKSKSKGVCLTKDGKRWRARIAFRGHRKYLGSFDTHEQASEAYKRAALELHGEFSNYSGS
jgi:hypothetical protein